MRTTVNLEPDLYALAKSVAATEDCSLSTAVNRLLRARNSLVTTQPTTGLPVSKGAKPVTSADISKFLAEEK